MIFRIFFKLTCIPAENFGRQFSCWRDGDPECVKKDGKAYKGRKCCEKVSKQFRIMKADMHNLFSAIGELNGYRKNFKYDFELATPGQHGECIFNVNFKAKRAKVKEDIKGIIARDYLYFNKQYGMKLSKQEEQKYNAWNKQYPSSDWAIEETVQSFVSVADSH